MFQTQWLMAADKGRSAAVGSMSVGDPSWLDQGTGVTLSAGRKPAEAVYLSHFCVDILITSGGGGK